MGPISFARSLSGSIHREVCFRTGAMAAFHRPSLVPCDGHSDPPALWAQASAQTTCYPRYDHFTESYESPLPLSMNFSKDCVHPVDHQILATARTVLCKSFKQTQCMYCRQIEVWDRLADGSTRLLGNSEETRSRNFLYYHHVRVQSRLQNARKIKLHARLDTRQRFMHFNLLQQRNTIQYCTIQLIDS